MNKEELRKEFEKETGISFNETVGVGDIEIPHGAILYGEWLESKLTQPQQTVSKEIQFIKHTLKAIIRWHRDERNPKNFPISSTLDALNYLDRLQAQTNEGELIEVAEMLELNINKLKKLIPC